MRKVAIIGGGATGTLLALNLLKFADEQPLEIFLIEKKNRFGAGVAYSTDSDFHLLNVPAGKMGAFPDDIEHFHRWLQENFYTYSPGDFVPRRIYGEYLFDLFRKEYENKPGNINVELISDEVIDISSTGETAEILLSSGRKLEADKVVLAFGNFLPAPLALPDMAFEKADKYSQNPWDTSFFEKLAPADDVLLLGTGLSMVDAALSLHNRGHRGKITAISRRGLLPAVHKLGSTYPSFEDEVMEQPTLRNILKTIRKHACKADGQSSDWRAVIDSVRPFTQKAWQALSYREKNRFLRHLGTYWNVMRHRMPPECAEILNAMKFAGRLEIKRGKIKAIVTDDDGKFHVVYGKNVISVDAIVNCTGSETNFQRLDVPLIKNLLARGMICSDPLFIGLEALPSGELVDSSGKISKSLYTIGTTLKGILWESTAMPELRKQARELALSFLQRANGASLGH